MPELAEVETIVRALAFGGRGGTSVLGCTIKEAFLYWDRTLATSNPTEFDHKLAGQKVISISRRAKFLVFKLSQDFLIAHLRMSGDMRVENKWNFANPVLLPHDRMALAFTNGSALVFNDPRKFGRVWLTAAPENVLGSLGPEPFDTALTGYIFYEMLHERKRQLKPLLMDQHFIAGLGNIYTDESLFQARLHPLTLSDSISMDQAEKLLLSIRSVLQEGIDRNGSSIDWVYRGGDFQNNFKVYQRNGDPCYVCETIIQRITVGQRGTHFCPHCQPDEIKI
jgi:formamidopyrimidine-DNA glycosylase